MQPQFLGRVREWSGVAAHVCVVDELHAKQPQRSVVVQMKCTSGINSIKNKKKARRNGMQVIVPMHSYTFMLGWCDSRSR